MKRFKILTFAALICLPAMAQAHSFWLVPAEYQLQEPAQVDVTFRVGDGDDIEPWNLRWDRIVSLVSIHEGKITDQQAGITVKSDGVDGDAKVNIVDAGTHLLAFASQPSSSDLEAARFNPYAEEEGLTAVLAERKRLGETQKNGTELYSRRAKTLIQIGSTTNDDVLKPIGQTLEIVPERHPYAMGNDRNLPVRVLFRGKPLEGGLVELIDLTAPARPVARQLTDAEGRTTLEIPERGAWRINLVWSVPNPGNDRADFETIFSSLSFGYD